MKKPLMLVLMLLPPGATVAAQQELQACALMDDGATRLACYDAAMNRPAPTSPPISGTGAWEVSISTNPLDDSKTAVARLDASEGRARFGQPIALIARCRSNTTEAYIAWGEYLGSEAYVTTRIGSGQATRARWSMSTDSQATFKSAPIPFLRSLMTTDRLVAQVTPYSESPRTAIFDLAGAITALKPISETCGWYSEEEEEEMLRLLDGR